MRQETVFLNYSPAPAGYLKATRAWLGKLTALIGYSSCAERYEPSRRSQPARSKFLISYLYLLQIIISGANGIFITDKLFHTLIYAAIPFQFLLIPQGQIAGGANTVSEYLNYFDKIEMKTPEHNMCMKISKSSY